MPCDGFVFLRMCLVCSIDILFCLTCCCGLNMITGVFRLVVGVCFVCELCGGCFVLLFGFIDLPACWYVLLMLFRFGLYG